MKNKLLTNTYQLNNKMKTMSNNFKLDNGMKIWQLSLIERQKRLELTNRPKIYL